MKDYPVGSRDPEATVRGTTETVTALILAAMLAGCSSDNTSSTEGGGAGGGCSAVDQGWVDQLSMPAGTYVYREAGATSTGHMAWVVKKDDGAVWATDVDPSTTPSSGGLIAPLNTRARGESDAGRDLSDEAVANLFPDASENSVSGC